MLSTETTRGAVRLQESVGLDVITDGEVRRLNFQDSFGAAVEGFDANRSTIKSNEQRVEGASPGQRWEIKGMHNTGTAVSHRRPATVPISLRMASRLAAAGIPMVVRHLDPATEV